MFRKIIQTIKRLGSTNNNYEQEVTEIVDAIGGLDNILEPGACATRLRLTLKQTALIDKKRLTDSGAFGVVILDEQHVQIIYGVKANSYSQIIEERLQTRKE
ncbi:PTS transporter subunit EIIB [Vibrio sinaloensis]|uniref:PTS glucose transporter subunit IIB n=1 Tax=Photobacterium sp. (strain ATCC 43367) TaxID=379097 RepID=A0A0A5JPE7_PHOS4|nr:PTS glucose/sucrose transporter subunit IIB [Vibrio sinaloensis]KGY09828.1 PTS glucose transporter subunit IIB [Vibrio sinaloensis]